MDGDRAIARVVARRVESLERILGELAQSAASLVVGDRRSDDVGATLIVGRSWVE